MIARILTGRGLNLVLRVLLGGLFVFASWHKVIEPLAFAMSVRGYKMIPFAYSNVFALVVSWSELIAGVMLILGIFTRKAAGAVAILLVMFIVAITMVVVRGMTVDCGCFSSEGGASATWLLIVRNVALLASSYLIMRYNDGYLSLFPGRTRSSN